MTCLSLARVVAYVLSCLLVLAGSRSLVQAQQRGDLERAEQSFRAGAAAYAAGDYAAAIQALEAAYELTPLPAIAFSLAQAERREYFVVRETRHLQRAVSLYRRYIEQVQSGGRRADALDALSQLEPLLATLPDAEPSANVEPSGERTRLMISCETQGARISLDGSEPVASPLIRETSEGVHRVRVESSGFIPVERDVTAVRGELVLSEVSLTEQPSVLVVSTVGDADVFVDGVLVNQGGPRVTLSLPSGTHQLAVAARGRRIAYRTLELERGVTTQVPVTLELTPMRHASRVLFVSGGLGFGVGLGLSVVALHAQGNARDFLSQRDRGNVSPARLDRYHDDVDRRDSYRVGAIVTLSASATLFVSGLLLHQLDRPNPREIAQRARDDVRERRPGQELKFSTVPQLSRSFTGASLRASF